MLDPHEALDTTPHAVPTSNGSDAVERHSVRDETTRATQPAPGALLALTRILTAPGAAEELIPSALAAGLNAIPGATELRLYGQGAAGAVAELGATRHTRRDTDRALDAETARLASEACTRRHNIRGQLRLALPLIAEGDALGSLVVQVAERAPLPLVDAVEVVASLLAALLNRMRHEHEVEAQGQAYDALIAMAAHELRSPLTSIKGYAQLMIRQSRRMPLPDHAQRDVDAIIEQSARLAEMIDQLHDAARVRRGRIELDLTRTDLSAMVASLVDRWRSDYPRHTFDVEVTSEPLIGLWDARRVEQTLRSLVDNAARYSPVAGIIHIGVQRAGGDALVVIRDHGIGLSASERPHVFDYLYRAANATERHLSGLGLGLYVARNVIERMSGRLWLEWSATGENGGSEFRMSLPLLRNTPDQAR